MKQQFEQAYRQHYSFLMPERELIVEAVSVEAVGRTPRPWTSASKSTPAREGALTPVRTVRMFTGGTWHDTALYRREDSRPAIAFAVRPSSRKQMRRRSIEPGWEAQITARNDLVLTRVAPRPEARGIGTAPIR